VSQNGSNLKYDVRRLANIGAILGTEWCGMASKRLLACGAAWLASGCGVLGRSVAEVEG
jgi:hypothetical protein